MSDVKPITDEELAEYRKEFPHSSILARLDAAEKEVKQTDEEYDQYDSSLHRMLDEAGVSTSKEIAGQAGVHVRLERLIAERDGLRATENINFAAKYREAEKERDEARKEIAATTLRTKSEAHVHYSRVVDNRNAEIHDMTTYASSLEQSNATLTARVAELENALAMVMFRWSFNNEQQHTHTWHDRADCFEVIGKALLPKGTP